jgi:arylsulfatase A-like enzyme
VMPFVRTWFGAGGTRYPHAFANTPLCCPARASIMTGRYAHNHGVRSNQSALSLDQDTTIQKALHDAGYRTALVGKFLNQWDLSTPPPNFDRWTLLSNVLDGVRFDNPQYYGATWNVDGALREVETYSTRFIGKRAVRFLEDQEAQDGVPWLLYVAPSAPHLPATAEATYADAPVRFWPGNPATAERDLSDKPPGWRRRQISLKEGRALRESQYRTLMSVDDLVERIAHKLNALDEGRSTLAFFVSDNGFLWGDHGRKGKTYPYNDSVGIPFYLRWPGHVPKGGTDRRLVALVDIAPTIRTAAGLAPNPVPAMDGRSLLDSAWHRDRLLLEYFPSADSRTREWASTWTRRFQYTEYYAPDTGEVTFREFYDLVADPWQLENLYGDGDPANDPSPQETEELSATLAEDRACAGSACP